MDTVRFYERRGLLPAPGRRPSGYRAYAEGTVDRIRLVKYIQSLGIQLDEIADILGKLDEGTATCGNQRARFEAVVERIDEEIATLRATRTKIVQMLRRCESGTCSLAVCLTDDPAPRPR